MAGPSNDSLADLIRRYFEGIHEFGRPLGESPPPDEISDLLGALLECLPKDSGIRTYNALKFALSYFIEEIGFAFGSPSLLHALNEYFQPRAFEFSIAIAESWYSIPLLEVGGRCELRLLTQQIEGRLGGLLLQGRVRAGHWVAAMELAEGLVEEASGLLAASGVLRYDLRQFSPTAFPGELNTVLSSSRADGERETHAPAMNWSHVRNVLSAALEFPHDVTEMEGQKVLNAEDSGGEAHDLMGEVIIRDRMQVALRAFSIGGLDSKRVRQAAQFLHRAEITESPADSYLAMATALEGLLVQGDGEQLSARVADAVAFNIGTSHSDRAKLRALAKKLYDVRSKYIHEGNYNGTEGHRHECLRMVERVVWRESRLLRAVDRADADAAGE